MKHISKLDYLKEQLFNWKYALAMDINSTVQDDFICALQEEIDAEIMFNVLQQMGWHCVELSTPADEIVAAKWLMKNNSGKYHRRSGGWRWLFENEKDAVMFSLRWL